MAIQISPAEARQKWNDVLGIAGEYLNEHESLIRAEMSLTELGDDLGLPFLIGSSLDPLKALSLFVGEEEQVFDIDLDGLEKEDPYRVTMNLYFMFVR